MRAQAQIEKQTKIIKRLQDQCRHPSYEKGLTMIACVQEVWICTECGHTKPLRGDWFSQDPNG